MVMDETLYSVQAKVQNFAVMYLVDITKVPDFNKVSLSFLLSEVAHPVYSSTDTLLDSLAFSFARCTNSTTLAHSCSFTETSTS